MAFAQHIEVAKHPVDRVEFLATQNNWLFDRQGHDEIIIAVEGREQHYSVAFTWMDDQEVLHLSAAFPLKAQKIRQLEVEKLIARINEQLWVGHFDYWSFDGVVMFRHGLLLNGGIEPSLEQCEAMLDCAVQACEKYQMAFQFVLHHGKTAREALDMSLFETKGAA